MGQKLGSKEAKDNFFGVTIAYLKENSKIKDNFSRKVLPRNKKNLFFGSKMRGQLKYRLDLYTGK